MKLKNSTGIFKMLAIQVSILFYYIPEAGAQLNWKNVDSAYGISHANVHVYALNDSFKGRPFRAFYVEMSLRDKHLQFRTQTGKGKRHTPSYYYQQEGNPLIVMNGTFFSFENNRNLNLVMQDGNVTGESLKSVAIKGKDSGYYYPFRSAIGIRKNGKADVAWIFSDSANNKVYALQERSGVIKGMNANPSISDLKKNGHRFRKWKMNTAIGGGPVLVQQGKVRITNQEERMFVNGEKDLHPRTSIGYTGDGRLILLVIEGRNPGIAMGANLIELAAILKILGCVEALNLDGGGSSCLLVNGKETIKPSDKEGQRAVPAVFMVQEK